MPRGSSWYRRKCWLHGVCKYTFWLQSFYVFNKQYLQTNSIYPFLTHIDLILHLLYRDVCTVCLKGRVAWDDFFDNSNLSMEYKIRILKCLILVRNMYQYDNTSCFFYGLAYSPYSSLASTYSPFSILSKCCPFQVPRYLWKCKFLSGYPSFFSVCSEYAIRIKAYLEFIWKEYHVFWFVFLTQNSL